VNIRVSISETQSKVTASHLQRDAYLYVRQSTMRQVIENSESAVRQYDLRGRAVALGWPRERVIVIDVDQGLSGATAADREGFQRLVADVSLKKAGIVLGLECSRLARNNSDWHRLLELCSLTDTLICDEDGLYDPSTINDRLLLGLKGAMSEAELHILRSRLRGGTLSKARRGELRTSLPVGLVYDPLGKVALDPDTAVQGAIRHLFECFERTGSARAVVKEFTARKLTFPQRIRTGPRKGETVWAPLHHDRVLMVLHNPRYAGAFSFGRRKSQYLAGKMTVRQLPRDQWTALIPDAHPGYISFAQFEANQELLLANAQARGSERRAGPPREGPALLQGLVICARCGQRMTVRYHHRSGQTVPEYLCQNEAINTATSSRCQTIPGAGVDRAIAALLLDTLTPVALEVALTVAAELEQRAEETDKLRQTHIERARHEAELARRRYLAVDPDNRLVANTLEADWNEKLRSLAQAQDEYEHARQNGNGRLSDEQRAKVMALASDFPRLWNDPATPQRERKRMVRLLAEDVTLARDQHITAHVRLKGGQTHTLTLPLPPPVWQARQTDPDTFKLIDQLLDDHTDAQTAELLNQAGRRTGTGQPFSALSVLRLRQDHHLPSHRQRLRARGLLTTAEMAQRLGVHTSTIKNWHNAGLLTGHKANEQNEQLYETPAPGDPRLVKHVGWSLKNRESNQSTPRGAV
jgi:DNA invertase Pin-like site-specific DNA recombinase